jgi:hypothetical protein
MIKPRTRLASRQGARMSTTLSAASRSPTRGESGGEASVTEKLPAIVIPRDATIDQAFRLWSDVLRIWRLCGRASCRRSHRCRGKARACFDANYPLLAPAVRDWFDAIGGPARGCPTMTRWLSSTAATRTRRFAPGRKRSMLLYGALRRRQSEVNSPLTLSAAGRGESWRRRNLQLLSPAGRGRRASYRSPGEGD